MNLDSGALNGHTAAAGGGSRGAAVDEELPPLAGLFVSYFDTKAGYTIAWKQTTQDVPLDSVEYKALPSGLHNVKEDLVYFVSNGFAGVSAFINHTSTLEERGALMLSVGALVPLSYGRLGRSWKHARNLKKLASKIGPCRTFGADTEAHRLLEEYFNKHRAPTSTQPIRPQSPLDWPSSLRFRSSAARGYKQSPTMDNTPIRRRQTEGNTNTKIQNTSLSPYHPALSLLELLDTFGPLVFPLYRAGLSRKRILLITQAPVEVACNFVYDISILSTIPNSASPQVRGIIDDESLRLKSLFSVGLHDLPYLEEQSHRTRNNAQNTLLGEDASFVACTTENIIGSKKTLYDILVTLPQAHTKNANRKVWPRIETNDGKEIRATQRDLRRYRDLRSQLEEFRGLENEGTQGRVSPKEEEEVCEKASWMELAYSGFLWWASAGEKRHDNAITWKRELFDPTKWRRDSGFPWQQNQTSGQENTDETPTTEPESQPTLLIPELATPHPADFQRKKGVEGLEMFIIAYFHRLTAQIITGISDGIDGWEDSDATPEDASLDENVSGEEEDTELLPRSISRDSSRQSSDAGKQWVSREDMGQMGLDMWSKSDERFVEEMGMRWWGTSVKVDGNGLCGCC